MRRPASGKDAASAPVDAWLRGEMKRSLATLARGARADRAGHHRTTHP
jgi:hypothetical protein